MEKRDSLKFCLYHNNHEHNTDDCQDLRTLLDTLIKEGPIQDFLKDFISTQEGQCQARRNQQQGDPLANQRRDVRMISTLHSIIGGAGAEAARQRSMRSHTQIEVHAAGLATPLISFTDVDLPTYPNIFDDAIVISAFINHFEVMRILIDTGSSVNILFLDAAERMRLNVRNFKPVEGPLVVFLGERCMPEGIITLEVILGTVEANEARQVDFFIIRGPSPYNCIFGRPLLNLFRAVVSIRHMAIKFPTMAGVVTVRGDMMQAQKCHLSTIKEDDEGGTLLSITGGAGDEAEHHRSLRRLIQTEVYTTRMNTPLFFTDVDLPTYRNISDEAIIISAIINRFEVMRILINTGSSANILFLDAAERMGLNIRDFKPTEGPLVGFLGERCMPEGTINLEVRLGPVEAYETQHVDFLIIKSPSPYNCIFGRTLLNMFKAVVSIRHMAIKFPAMASVGTVRGDMAQAQKCHLSTIKDDNTPVFRGRGMTISKEVTTEEAIKITTNEVQPSKKIRVNSPCKVIPQVKVEDCDNNDCYEIDPIDYTRKITSSSSNDENVAILSEKDPVALRDFPHPRHLCGNFPFSRTTHESYCSQCFCYVCEVAAPCSKWWGCDGHCNVSRK